MVTRQDPAQAPPWPAGALRRSVQRDTGNSAKMPKEAQVRHALSEAHGWRAGAWWFGRQSAGPCPGLTEALVHSGVPPEKLGLYPFRTEVGEIHKLGRFMKAELKAAAVRVGWPPCTQSSMPVSYTHLTLPTILRV